MAAVAALSRIGIKAPKLDIDPEPMIEEFKSVYDDKGKDLYSHWKTLEEYLEFLTIQENYVKDEMKHLKNEYLRAQEEVKRIQSVPLIIGQFLEMIDENHAIVGSTNGSNYYTRVLSTLNKEKLKPSASVALHRHAHSVVDILPPEADSTVNQLAMQEKPDISYDDIGGLDIQKQV